MNSTTILLSPVLLKEEGKDNILFFADISTNSFYDLEGVEIKNPEIKSKMNNWLTDQFNDSMRALENLPNPQDIEKVAQESILKAKKINE